MSADSRTASRVVVIEDPPEVEVTLRALGRITVRAGDRGVERELAAVSRRPLVANHRAVANAVLAASVDPHVLPRVIDERPERDRHKLMLAVVRLRDQQREWRLLYGSALSVDERFFAVMLWSYERDRERLGERIRQRLIGLREKQARQPAVPTRAVKPALPQVRVRPVLAAANLSRSLAVTGRIGTYEQLVAPSAQESLFGRRRLFTNANSLRKTSLTVARIDKHPSFLSATGASERSAVPGLASVLRPYTGQSFFGVACPGFVGAGSSVKLGVATLLPLQRAMSPRLAHQVAQLASDVDISGAARVGLRGTVASSVLSGITARRLFPARDRATFAVGLGGARVAEQMAAALGRPLLDGRTRLLFERAGVAVMLAGLRAPVFDGVARSRDVLPPMGEFGEMAAELSDFLRVWESDPLWFLLSVFGMRSARRFSVLTREQVEESLLSALTEVVQAGEFVEALRGVLKDAPHLNDVTREWLDHALELAAAGEWVKALPPMLNGLEGALHGAAVERALIIERGGKFMAVEALVKQMAVDEHYTAFLVRRVFGGIGNSFRHGRANSGARDPVLFAVAALAGWVDFFLEPYAMRVLGDELSQRLDDAIATACTAPQLAPV